MGATAINSIANDERPCEPLYPADELLGLVPSDLRQPLDMHEVIVRLVDGSGFLPFKALYGAATVCVQASIDGHAVGIISNNGPIDVAGANKATHFIQWMCQLGHPIVYLQNTTGYMVGKESEQAGMIKHGSKMIQAVTNATVPQSPSSAARPSARATTACAAAAMRRAFFSAGPAPKRR
jgi:geranyl-CoA carboxylase beta subunit